MMVDMHSRYMALAIRLAMKGSPSPNPFVGAVLVKNKRVISTGYHRKAGAPHAEINALKKGNAKGATLYVNLEPCSHYGKTGPCTKAIIEAGVKKVVIGMEDPNQLVKGIEELRKRGIKVEVGIMEKEAKRLNEVFIKYIKTGLPFVVLKTAMSLDGKIACNNGKSKWITNSKSRKYVHELRDRYDAILVGIETVLKDNPRLTCRIKGGRDPLRVILDSRLRIPSNSNALKDSNVIIATTKNHSKRKRKLLERKGINVLVAGERKVNLKKLMRKLGKGGITSVVIEGGSEVNASALKEGIVDKVLFFISPKLITGRSALSPVGGDGISGMNKAIRLEDVSIRRFGEDMLVEGYANHPT